MHDDEFGGVYIRYSAEKLRLLGITFGDSVDIEFSNGFTVKGLPYYSGYYNPAGEALLVAYPGYPFIKAAVNFGGDLWDGLVAAAQVGAVEVEADGAEPGAEPGAALLRDVGDGRLERAGVEVVRVLAGAAKAQGERAKPGAELGREPPQPLVGIGSNLPGDVHSFRRRIPVTPL